MSQYGRTLPLFNRIVIGVMSTLLIALGIAAVVEMVRAGQVLPFKLFLAVVSPTCGAAFLWAAIRWRELSDDEMSDELNDGSIIPEQSQSAVRYSFLFQGRAQSIGIDIQNDRVWFQNCLTPRRFLASPLPMYSCSIADLKAAYVFRYRGETLTVATDAGKATIPSGSDDYAELRDIILERVPNNDTKFETDNPLIGLVLLFGMLLGGGLGIALLPRNAGEGMLLLAMVGGSVAGAGASFALSHLAASKGIAVVKPIAFLVIGAVVGLIVINMLGRNAPPALPTIGICSGIGLAVGAFLQFRQQRRSRHS